MRLCRFEFWLAVCLIFVGAPSLDAQSDPTPLVIVSQPQNVSIRTGEAATFLVSVQGDPPMGFQWYFNGLPIPGATGPIFGIPAAYSTNAGWYSVVVTNRFAATTSELARLTIDADLVFRILELRTNSAITVNGYDLVGYDLGVIAAGSNYVYLTGRGNPNSNFEYVSYRVSAATLASGVRANSALYALVSNLRTERLYSLGNGSTPITYLNSLNFTTVTSLLEIDENTGNVVRVIPLSSSIPIGNTGNIGIFAGWDRIVIHGAVTSGSYHVYNIALPSGAVTDLGGMTIPSHQFTDGWAYWGIAEYFEGTLHLVYARDFQSIVRRSVPAGVISELGTFNNLGNMAMITFSPSRSRWYFRHQGSSQFGPSTTTYPDTLGSAKATFTTDPGYPSILRDPQTAKTYVESNVVLNVIAGGEQPLSYQWLFNGSELPGATNNTLTLTNVQPGQSGTYTVRVSNRLGETVSGRGILDVVWLPRILGTPIDRSVFSGTNITFSVTTDAAPPVQYQWFFNDNPIPGATSGVLILTNIQPSMDGFYTLQVSNRFGPVMSRRIELNVPVPVDDGAVFEVTALQTNGSATVDAYQLTDFSFQNGPFAASSNGLFTSTSTATWRFALDNLGGQSQVGSHYFGLISNLRTETAYAIGNETGPFDGSGGTATVFWELNALNGTRTGVRINLSLPIPNVNRYFSQVGFLAGYDEALILNGSRAYRISLPSGVVTDLGPMTTPTHISSSDSAFWGIAEHFGGVNYIVYAKNSRTIARARVPDSVEFAPYPQFINLSSSMASITASIRRNRWYFHHQFGSQFDNNNNDTIGYAAAAFRIKSGPNPDHFDFAPIDPLQAVNVPIPVTIYARNSDNVIATNFNGNATLRGVNATNGQIVQISPLNASNFVAGVWTGFVTVAQVQPVMYLRTESAAEGLSGISGVFAINPSNDLAVMVTDTPDPVVLSYPVSYSIRVTNYGPTEATGVMLTNIVPASASIVSIAPSQGSCTNSGGIIVCELGTVPGGSAASITMVLMPTVSGAVTNRVSISRAEADANPGNNTLNVLTTVMLPALSISDISVIEGDSGSNDVIFTITLSPPVTNTVTANFTTQANTASSLDFVANSGQLVFDAGVTSQTVSVTVRGDTLFETNELFFLTLFSPNGATMVTNRGSCTIFNDDSQPSISVLDTSLSEPDSGSNAMTFRIAISAPAGLPIVVNYATSNGTAIAGTDYHPRSGILTFPPSTAILTQSVTVQVIGDTVGERDESLYLLLTTVANAVVLKRAGTGIIVNNDPLGNFDHFAWEPVGARQIPGQPIMVTVRAMDPVDALIPNFAGPVRLSAVVPQPSFTGTVLGGLTDQGTFSGGLYTIGFAFTPSTNIRVTHVRSYSGTKVSIWRDNGQLLVAQPVTSNPGSWTDTPLPIPVQLTAGSTYRVAFYGGDETYYYASANLANFQHGSLGNALYSSNDSFPTNDLGGTIYLVDLAYTVDFDPLPIRFLPTNTVTFTNGVWSGPVTVLESGTNVVLHAEDTQKHVGDSNPFDVVPVTEAEVALSAWTTPNPCRLASTVIYHVVVTNRGPAMAADVVISNSLPSGFRFVSADASQGTWTNAGDNIVASFGNISAATAATCTIEVTADSPGTNISNVRVFSTQPDPNPYNNSVQITSVIFVDRDNDGLWDEWEQQNNLQTDNANDAGLDPDHDGHTNLQEFIAGTDPHDSNSVLRVSRLITNGDDVRITFRGIRGRRYRLERLDNWSGSNWMTVAEFRVGAISNVNLFDSGATGRPWCIYRIRTLP